jgi:hypothetical protein
VKVTDPVEKVEGKCRKKGETFTKRQMKCYISKVQNKYNFPLVSLRGWF